jgi:hypothetical protein
MTGAKTGYRATRKAAVPPCATSEADLEAARIEHDRDQLHILPLGDLPLATPRLRNARLIKNVRLETVIELFQDGQTGSGQIEVDAFAREAAWDMNDPPTDLVLLHRLEALPSFDVYSLRIQLRANGIPVNSQRALKLSAAKQRELTEYMAMFTRPLIAEIYGGADRAVHDFADLVGLFVAPDVKQARQKLSLLAERLEIEVRDVPRFLEDYGDIFLSLSYFRQCLDAITPTISDFLVTLDGLGANWQLRSDTNLMRTCRDMEAKMNGVLAAISGRFENFERSTANMWGDLSAARFRQVENLIKGYHTTIGGVLCALSVKMNAWQRLFPRPDAGGPVKRAEFLMSEMRQGMNRIRAIEDRAPMLAELAAKG